MYKYNIYVSILCKCMSCCVCEIKVRSKYVYGYIISKCVFVFATANKCCIFYFIFSWGLLLFGCNFLTYCYRVTNTQTIRP